MVECIDVLEFFLEVVLIDKYFCYLVWMYKFVEEVGIQFFMDDFLFMLNIVDFRI